jgi:hypothetical protein
VGVALWLLCGVAVFAGSRMIAGARPERFATELTVAILVSVLAGLTATALDFGGWAEVDWRAGLFVICCGFAAVGGMRVIGLIARRPMQR